ncbi:M23 family metallopeptidase [Fulvimarina sp. 2208YS6-2-32]|uniref:M23 family metallopeptidase n=1 Tax=Fulvimarina uroteuthidis TaxID=3098149 RepID=A0ABU5I3I7_9HYPH|nr:M23 family metallopeptidase [Fulvimarina sp. 2208YS6-2-32]MDY8109925.1 M23 family metallopeptidase [Fulvimarina sp. 2208YS6-2-32]
MVHGKPAFGDEPPLLVDRRRKPDRRQVSLRWLAGTLLTGVTSSALMGIALSAALENSAGAALPSHIADYPRNIADVAEKGARVFATALPLASSHQVVELSTLVRDGDREVVSTRPFALVNMLLAARHPTTQNYPRFDPISIMSESLPPAEEDDEDRLSLAATQIYGDRMESGISLNISEFSFDEASYEAAPVLTSEEAEQLVRETMPSLRNEPIQVASLSRLDPFRFGFSGANEEYEPGSAFRIIQENVSFEPSERSNAHPRFYEEIVPVRESRAIVDALEGLSERGVDSKDAGKALADQLKDQMLSAGDALRLGIESVGETRTVIRLSAYRGKTHLGTVAETQDGVFEEAYAPEMADSVAAIFDERESEAPIRADMPTIYDGLYQAGLAYGFDQAMCQELIRTLASEVDLQSRLSPTDRLSVFYTMDEVREGEGEGATRSDILSVSLKLGDMEKTLYRFKPDGADRASYFDAEGRSARQFLIRKPLPRGRFTSAFSTGRKHPVLGYVRPHWGVDWAAPSGTPILAAANGTVIEEGWKSGYGRHTKIKHANGYVTSYSHQSAFAKGLSEGTTVKQGQVIGYVGSTGLSTGNHLHYEIEVNGKKVDPMRIKVGAEQVLKSNDLTTFTTERERIDALIAERFEAPQIASK